MKMNHISNMPFVMKGYGFGIGFAVFEDAAEAELLEVMVNCTGEASFMQGFGLIKANQ